METVDLGESVQSEFQERFTKRNIKSGGRNNTFGDQLIKSFLSMTHAMQTSILLNIFQHGILYINS